MVHVIRENVSIVQIPCDNETYIMGYLYTCMLFHSLSDYIEFNLFE